MRMRVVHTTFWTDKVMGKLSDSARLVYVGIWMLSDDAGWSEWDPEQMATELFPWQAIKVREQRFNKAAEELIRAGRVVRYECGHAEVPNLHLYQRAGHPTYAVRDFHRNRCQSLRMIASDSASKVKESRVREGKEARPHEGRPAGPDGPVGFDEKMPGLKENLGGR